MEARARVSSSLWTFAEAPVHLKKISFAVSSTRWKKKYSSRSISASVDY
uniref:Ovule protein n=1 Tax=Parascaris univalens TaxID=6257 RepID=A0A914ZMC7_PARUN